MRLYTTNNHGYNGIITGEVEKVYTASEGGIPCLRVVFKDCSIETYYFSEYEEDSSTEQCAKALKWIYQQLGINESGIIELNPEMHFSGSIDGTVIAIDGFGAQIARIAKKNAMIEYD